MQLTPYLDFDGRCDEAIAFYKKALNAEVTMLMRFKDNPEPNPNCVTPGSEQKVMHASLRIGDSTLMASDGRCQGGKKFEGISLSFAVPTDAAADKAFAGLSEGGQVCMPLAKTFFSSKFGMVTDRFGVMWMVMVMMAH